MGSKIPSIFVTLVGCCTLLSGCNKAADSSYSGGAGAANSSSDTQADATASSAPHIVTPTISTSGPDHAPGVDASAASNVAFAYRYAFALPAESISDVQQQHVTACQKLGPDECEVTSFTLHQTSEDEATGEVDFKIDRNLAHDFGRDAINTVKKADGKLSTASVEGADNNGSISDAQNNKTSIQAQLDAVEHRLGSENLPEGERVSLRAQAAQLRQILVASDNQVQGIKRAIAKTPVIFTYESQGVLAGGRNPFGTAASASLGSITTVLSLLLMMLGVTLPWVLLIGVPALAVWLWLRARQKKQSLATEIVHANPEQ